MYSVNATYIAEFNDYFQENLTTEMLYHQLVLH